MQDRRQPHAVVLRRLIENEVVVVSARIAFTRRQLGEVLADRLHDGEVERGVGHRRNLAGRDERRVDGRVTLRGNLQHVPEDVARAVTGEVPVGVVREVDHRRRISGGRHVHHQLVHLVERVDDLGVDIARIAFFAVLRAVREGHRRTAGGHHRVAAPHNLVEALDAAVQMVGAVIGGNGVLLAIDGELAAGDAIGAAANGAAEVLRALDIVLRAGSTEHDIGESAGGVGDLERNQDGPVVGDLRLHALAVAKSPEVNGLTADLAPILLGDAADRHFLVVACGGGARRNIGSRERNGANGERSDE